MSMKVFGGAIVLGISSLVSFIALQTTGSGIPSKWIFGTLVTILIAVLTAFGAILKIAYDTAKKWDTVLKGHPAVESDEGFIEESEHRHTELQQSQERIYEQLVVQGQLLSEMAYSFADIAEELQEADDIDVNVDVERIEKLHKRKKKEEQQRGEPQSTSDGDVDHGFNYSDEIK